MLTKETITGFLEQLGSSAPAPGGGAAAALAGAMGAALVEMVAKISLKKSESPAELERIAAAAEKLRASLTQAIDADTAAYGEVDQALKLPKGTEEEKQRRREALEQALKHAAEVPLRTAELCLEVLNLASEALPLASKYVRSDLGVAAQLARAGLHSALYNVDANCLLIKEEDYLAQIAQKRAALLQRATEKNREIMEEIESRLTSWLGERDSNPH